MANTIYAAFADPDRAERAVGALLDHGVRPEDISVVRNHPGETISASIPPPPVTTSEGTVVSTPTSGTYAPPVTARDEDLNDIETSAKKGISITSPADAGAGAIKGTAWGAGLGVLAAIAAVTVPGFGIVLGGGALATALGAVAASAGAGAVAGAVTGYLKDQGVDEKNALHYEETIGSGGALVAVSVPSGGIDEMRVNEILTKYGATGVNSYATRGYVA